MRRVAVFADAGYFWVQVGNAVLGTKAARSAIKLDYDRLRTTLLDEVATQFPGIDLLRVYWYDGPSQSGKKTSCHHCIDKLDDFKLRLGTRNLAGQQKAVDGLIIADILGLAQSKAITDALLVTGDADMTPGLVAAQNLGLRVHLLVIDPAAATSPQLIAEADRKLSWNTKKIAGFARPQAPDAGKAQPNVVPPGIALSPALTYIAAPGTEAETQADAATTSSPLIAVPNWTTVAQGVHASLAEGPNSAALANLKTGVITLPKLVDGSLLRAGAAAVARSLEEAEKRLLRLEFKKLLKKSSTETQIVSAKTAPLKPSGKSAPST
jgi:uncharacterized LabA/DUF88 family protein